MSTRCALLTVLYNTVMNKDYTALSIKRTLLARLRKIASKNQRTPQGQIEHWVKAAETSKDV
jgi:hypothetical protein